MKAPSVEGLSPSFHEGVILKLHVATYFKPGTVGL
jgi:hypothetical protein